jgi:hypothetical protein
VDLASDLFDTLVVSMRNYDQVAEYLAVSGTTSLTARRGVPGDGGGTSGPVRQPGCGLSQACPHGVSGRHLRYKM